MEPKRKRSSGNNWIGMVIFLVIAFGSPVSKFITSLIFQTTGQLVSSNILAIGMVTLIVLAVAVSAIGAAVRGTGNINTGSDTRLPSGLPTPPPTMSAGQPTSPFPGSPRFEPMINPRILAVGIIGLVLFGGIFLAILSISGAL
ncbi:MAG: hypothetical protein WCK70_02130 [Chloroflexales bacterium]